MSYQPSLPYEYHLPPQPRLTVPPPDIDPFTRRGSSPANVTELNGFSGSYTVNPLTSTLSPPPTHPFLPTLDPQAYLCSSTRVDWNYADRRKAQAILPFLYLGPFPVAKDSSFLRSEGITMVVAVRNTLSAQANLLTSKIAESLGIETATVDVRGNQELIAAFPRATNLINAHLSRLHRHDVDQQFALRSLYSEVEKAMNLSSSPLRTTTPGKVLLYCESGNDRSAAVVAAYVMEMYALDLIGVIQLLQNQRFCAAFDDEMKILLSSYADLVVAKRDVARSRAVTPNSGMGNFSNGDRGGSGEDLSAWHANGFTNGHSEGIKNVVTNANIFTKPKRRLAEDDEDMDECGEQNMDEARFERREGFAPFVESVEND